VEYDLSGYQNRLFIQIQAHELGLEKRRQRSFNKMSLRSNIKQLNLLYISLKRLCQVQRRHFGHRYRHIRTTFLTEAEIANDNEKNPDSRPQDRAGEPGRTDSGSEHMTEGGESDDVLWVDWEGPEDPKSAWLSILNLFRRLNGLLVGATEGNGQRPSSSPRLLSFHPCQPPW